MISNAFLLKQKRGHKAGDLVYGHDYYLNHRCTAAVVSKRHRGMVYKVETGNEKWLLHPKKLRPNHSQTSKAQTGTPLFTLLDIFDLGDSLPSRSTLKEFPVGQPVRIAHLRGNRWTQWQVIQIGITMLPTLAHQKYSK